MKRINIATDSQEMKDPPPGALADGGNMFFAPTYTCDMEGCGCSNGSGTVPKFDDDGDIFVIASTP